MNKGSIVILFIILLITFFISFLAVNEKKLYFSLNGGSYLELNVGEDYNELGYKAEYCNKYVKLFCEDISRNVKVTQNNKGDKLFINYNIIYKKENKILTREIVLVDKEGPVIELNGDDLSICPNEEYKELGYKAYDNVDGDITDKVQVNIKDNKAFYNVKDSSGNSKVVFRNINFVDNEAPILNLNGSNKIYIFKDREYTDSGYSAIDNCDGNISSNIHIDSNVDTSKVGDYKINYSISDTFGNKTTITRDVIVYDDISVIPKNGKVVYLTFDDGPGSYTEDILNVLDKYNVKATFFVTNQFSSYQDLIKKEYEKGHAIAVHTYSHNYRKIYSSVDDYINDFNNMNEVIFEQTGEYSKIFRFPGGSSNTISRFNKGIMSELVVKLEDMGYYYFDWNVDSMDTSYKDPNKIAENVINEISKNEFSVVLMHDIKKANIESVEKIVFYGLENGYTFLPLDTNSPIVHHTVNN